MDFGAFEEQNEYSSSAFTLNVEDDENPLGELAKPISTKGDVSPHNRERDQSSSSTPKSEFKDHLIAQTVDMRFSVDETEAALAAT